MKPKDPQTAMFLSAILPLGLGQVYASAWRSAVLVWVAYVFSIGMGIFLFLTPGVPVGGRIFVGVLFWGTHIGSILDARMCAKKWNQRHAFPGVPVF